MRDNDIIIGYVKCDYAYNINYNLLEGRNFLFIARSNTIFIKAVTVSANQ